MIVPVWYVSVVPLLRSIAPRRSTEDLAALGIEALESLERGFPMEPSA